MRKRNTKKPNFLPLIIAVIIICTLIINPFINYWNTKINSQDITLTIESWDNLSTLYKNTDLNIDKTKASIYRKLNKISFNLQKWEYKIPSKTTYKELLEIIKKSPITIDENLTILEWYNIFDIDDLLTNKWLIKTWDFIKKAENINKELINKYSFIKNATTLEWFLYPDTYSINPKNFSSDILINSMLENFEKKVYNPYLKNIDSTKIMNTLILASIVEKESSPYWGQEEAAIVAWILQKRIDESWNIWADATVCYPYKKTSKECTPKFIGTKVNSDINDYNTRTKLWLPITPIANPSLKAIIATINQKSSPYYYYLHDNSGKIHYWITNQDHINNKNEYLR